MRRSLTPVVAAVVLAAKAATIALRLCDGGGRDLLSPLAPVVLVYEDAWLVLGFALVEWALGALATGGTRRSRTTGIARDVLFIAIVAWTAINVPIVRVFSTPATFSMLNASGGAITDSIAVYLTFANIAIPLMLMVAAGLARYALRPHPSPREAARARAPASSRQVARADTSTSRAAAAIVLVVVAAAGAKLGARLPTLGLHRNAVVTLATTTAEHWRALGGANAESHRDRDDAACAARDGAATDLRDLRGAAAGRNVVWIILESTAARFLTTYGAKREVTPNLSALAREAVIFDDAYAAYPESIKGLYSMLCARSPLPRREAAAHAQGRAPCEALPERLRSAGYRTALFHSGRFAYLGMRDVIRDRGFETLEDGATIGGAFRSSFGVDEASTVRRLLGFVDTLTPDERFFAVYLPIAGHHPYHAPGGGPRPFVEHAPVDAYANDLFAGDAAFGVLRDGLRRRGLDDKTLYLVVGDHGEAFFEHEGNFAHTLFLYEENVRVPFIVAAPGLWHAPRHAPQLASLMDVGPTLLDLIGLSPGTTATGRSLLDPRARVVKFFTDQGLPQSALRDGRWKVIAEQPNGRAQLYDLTRDPGEHLDLAPSDPARAAHYASCLDPRGG